MVDDFPRGKSADRRANPLRRGDRALGQIVTAGAAHDIGDDERRQRLVDSRADSVQQLHGDQPKSIVGKRIERRANRQDGEGDEEDRPPPPGVRSAPDENRDRQHDALRGDDAERHHRGRFFRKLEGELLPDQRQKRRIGEMEEERAERENDQRPGAEQDAIAGGRRSAFVGVLAGADISRAVMIDRAAGMQRTAAAVSAANTGTIRKTAAWEKT